ncbi:MAG: DUF4417 domain-containing protein [Gammaproteobacteria bacterium]|nr:DUF4417 domain-containing protein [Gammaproteobacteria bacterium]
MLRESLELSVCRNKPRDFARRVREVGGFQLDNVPRASALPDISLPGVVPVLYHGDRRAGLFAPPAVCLPLYAVVRRSLSRARFADADDVARTFKFKSGTPLVLTGTDIDRPLERWWSLGGNGRKQAIRVLKGLDVQLVTTPNYSMFTDRPRWDDMHSMKRIALTHQEFVGEGVRAALHVNAITERDWERWTEYVHARSEVKEVAYEFATGAGWAERTDWHIAQLVGLSRNAGRPLHLVVRAAPRNVLGDLAAAFSGMTVLDTSTFIKTVRRQRGRGAALGKIEWQPSPTEDKEALDELLMDNWSVVRCSYDHHREEAYRDLPN